MQTEVAIALNQKVVDKFLVCAEGEGDRQGARLQCPISPLLSQEVEHSLPPFLHQWQKNMICAESEDPPPSTTIASPTGHLTAS